MRAKVKSAVQSKNNTISITQIFSTIVAVIVMLGVTMYIFYPGIINADVVSQLSQARSFEFTDWHPPIMSFLWFLLNHIHDGVQVMFIFHQILFWVALCLLSFWMAPHSGLLRIVILFSFGFFPTVLGQLGVVFKDSAMSISLLMASIFLLHASQMNSRIKLLFLSAAIIFLFYGFSVRLNSAPAVLVLCFWLGDLVNHKKFYNGIVTGFLLFVVLFVTSQIVTNTLLNSRKTYPLQQVQAHDLAAISLTNNKPIFPEYIVQSANFSMSRLRKEYIPANVGELLFYHQNTIKLTNSRDNIKELNSIWLNSIYKYPGDYFKHRLKVFGYLLYGCMAYFDDLCRPVFADFKPPSSFLYNWYCRLTVNGFFKFLFHSWIYAINCLVIIVVTFWQRKRLLDFKPIIYLSLSGLLYVMGSFFFTPACEFRYVYWTVIASLLAFLMLIKSVFKVQSKN